MAMKFSGHGSGWKEFRAETSNILLATDSEAGRGKRGEATADLRRSSASKESLSFLCVKKSHTWSWFRKRLLSEDAPMW